MAKPQVGKEELQLIGQVFKSGILASGPKVAEFEKKFADFIGVKHAVAVNSGTAALQLAILSLGITKGDEIITTPFSFMASTSSILYAGAKPVFVDIKDDFNINVSLMERKITKKTKAILPVHIFGMSCDMVQIKKIAKKHKLFVIEDACQAHGAVYKGLKVGSIGDVGCFSFYPTKNMTTGEGGIITTNSDKVMEKARILRNQGQKIRYYHDELSYNFRMTDINAAIGLIQLQKLSKLNEKRLSNALFYFKTLKNIKGLVLPQNKANKEHVYHQFTIRITNDFPLTRDAFVKYLSEKGIDTGVFYPVPITDQSIIKSMGYSVKCSVSDKISDEVISIPVHPALKLRELKYIVDCILAIKKI